LKPILRLKR